ncbi:MAG: metallophosphoesterase [Chloroflexi bacterium]|nr:metallophosphoesterase [Chloroflexota bacterium]
MMLPTPRRRFASRAFWYALSTFTHAIGRLWRNPTQYEPVVEHVDVPIAGLPGAFDGLKIAHMSDFHAGPHVYAETLRRAAERTLSLGADLIALTGDFVHRSIKYMPACADALGILRAPLGVHVVLGNHDYWSDVRVVARQLRRVGLHPMHNEARQLRHGDHALYVIGVDDVRFRRADLSRALDGVPDGAFKVMLVHEPDFADFAAPGIALQLSGHSHGGQIRLPRIGALLLPSLGRKYPAGLQQTAHGMWVYTTRGVGVAMPPLRYHCPPEISLLTLRQSGG